MRLRTPTAFVSVALLLLAAGRVEAQPAGDGRAEPGPLLVQRLRTLCAGEPALLGVRIVDCRPTPESVRLIGLVDREEQRPAVAAETQRLLRTVSALEPFAEAAVETDDLRPFPIRSTFLGTIQQAFATNQNPDASIAELLRRTRLDEAYFDATAGLVVTGVSIADVPRDDETAERADTPPRRLVVEIEAILERELGRKEFRGLNLYNDRVAIRFLGPPSEKLQTAVVENRELDGVSIASAAFDEDGVLVLRGRVRDEDQRGRLAEFLAEELANSPLVRDEDPLTATVASLAPFPLDEFRSLLQASFAESDAPELRRTRFERVYFDTSGRPAAEITLLVPRDERDEPEADAADPADADPDGATRQREQRWRETLQPLVSAAVVDVLEEWPAGRDVVEETAVATVRLVDSPLDPLRARIAETPPLDGVRVDEVRFDEDGALVLAGLWVDGDQRERLAALVERTLAGGPLASAPVSFEDFREVDTADLLADLRAWSAKTLDEVWFERLYFDETGRLAVAGSHVADGDDALVGAKLRELVARHPVVGHLNLPAGEKPDEALAQRVETKLVQHETAVSAALQSLVAREEALDGVNVARAFYDEQGRLHVEGVQDAADQAEQLPELVARLERDPRFAGRLSGGIVADEFAVQPIGEMVDGLQEMLPANPAFDGVQITSAFHDEDGLLSFRGVVHGPLPQNAERELKTLLERRPDWRRRTTAGVTLKNLESRRPRVDVARAARGKAVLLAQTGRFGRDNLDEILGLLNTSIANEPDRSTAWFLRAMTHLAAGREKLAERDLHRVVQIESKNGSTERLRELERVQTSLRLTARSRLDDVRSDVELGKKLDPFDLLEEKPQDEAR